MLTRFREVAAVLELTKTILSCSRCPIDFQNGDGLLPGVPPRGWAGSPTPGTRPILVASLNPSHPPQEEVERLARAGLFPREEIRTVTDSSAAEVLRIGRDFYGSQERSKDHIFARRVVGYIRATAWLVLRADPSFTQDPRTAPWESLAWITDAYKCSTLRDSGPAIPEALLRGCVEAHLVREIAACGPRVVLALGNPAAATLAACGIPHHQFRHGANGCPALEDRSHDESFAGVAADLGLDRGIAASEEFRSFRRDVESDLFPSKAVRDFRRASEFGAGRARATGLTQSRLRELIADAGLAVAELKAWPRVDGVSGRMVSFGNDPRIREVHLRYFRIPHRLCSPMTAAEARARRWASVRGRIRPVGHPTQQVEEAVRLALRALVDPAVGEQVD